MYGTLLPVVEHDGQYCDGQDWTEQHCQIAKAYHVHFLEAVSRL